MFGNENYTSQPKEKERPPALNTTDWKTSHGLARAQKDTENVSPRSKGETPLSDKQTEEIRRRIEEAKEKAKMTSAADAPSRSASQAAQPPAIAHSTSDPPPRPDLSSVSPDLLKELRKIIREEVEQLNKGEEKAEPPEAGTGKTPRPSVPSSSARPWTGTQGSAPATSSKEPGDKNVTSTTAGQSPTTTQAKDSPRHSTVRFSDETKPAVPVTPRGIVDESKHAPTSKSSKIELTAIDQRWGTLFEKDGTPTKRMDNVVQGLANYIIDEFIPQESIVITPEKMAAFYSYHRLDKEVFPFAVLFKSRSKDLNGALAALYEDFGCQYFLVPVDARSRPTVPGLTPTGFSRWLVTMIQAYPDEEAKRLDKIVSDLPIEADSLLDGKSERLPKQISRYLLPEKPLRKSQKLVDEAMRDFIEVINNTQAPQAKRGNSGGGGSSSKPTPIVTTPERRPSTTTNSGASSRYVPENLLEKNRADEGGSGHDKLRRTTSMNTSSRDARDHDNSRKSMPPPPPGPGHLGRTHSLDNNGKSASRTPHVSSSSGGSNRAPATSTSSSKKNRSPQRKPHSQSAPNGLDRSDPGTDRIRGSSTISAVAATVAAVLGSSSLAGGSAPAAAPVQSNSSSDNSTRGSRTNGGDSAAHRDKRISMDEPAPRAPASGWNLRDKGGLENSSSGNGNGSRSAKRRSVVLPDVKGPTWDDYLKSSAPKSATPAFMKRGDIG
ncbi:hypothetical protein VSDG_00819 [Cytospora chrysosperma]|uniref:DUF7514 domain-containing protein n=1 Tax=Cytospora chrysosperma TaxID=252740 RepID=A0A423WL92_CYTCH|nr:hypothetical protein VSDG_00819 [Valsa sordida]